ncbi:MAG: hypothetical protein R2939_18495 [Kofleriaceae bacterium]
MRAVSPVGRRRRCTPSAASPACWSSSPPAGRALPAPTPIRIEVRDCLLVPQVQVAKALPAVVDVIGAGPRRHQLRVDEVGTPARLGTLDGSPSAATVSLPWMGATVRRRLAAPSLLRVTTVEDGDDPAWVLATGTPYAAVTDDEGVADLGAAPPGTYPVVAWLPPTGGGAGASRAAR